MCSGDNIVELGGLILHENPVQVIRDSVTGNMMRPSRLWFRTKSSTNSVHHLQNTLQHVKTECIYLAAFVSTDMNTGLC